MKSKIYVIQIKDLILLNSAKRNQSLNILLSIKVKLESLKTRYKLLMI